MIVALIAAAGAPWESGALQALGDHSGVVVLKRCVDVDDLLAAASAGQAHVAVVALDAPSLDVTAVDHLRRHGVRPVAVVSAGAETARARAGRLGITAVVDDDAVARLGEVVSAPDPEQVAPPESTPADEIPVPAPGARGRVFAVWGPAGAPGRTTVAVSVAAELARRQRRTILVDADPYGGAVAQQLGILDEVSGLLSAARLVAGSALVERFATVQRGIDARLSVITGLPRPDRYAEVRAGTIEHVLETARSQALVVVDTGFSLEDEPARDYGARPGRNQLTLGSLEVCDEVIAVGAADPVGLARLARGLADLREQVGTTPVRVVVNRMRSTLGWSERDIGGMVTGITPVAGLHFLPDGTAAVDRALVAGRALVETGESELARAFGALVDALPVPPAGPPSAFPVSQVRPRRVGLRRRTAGRARRP